MKEPLIVLLAVLCNVGAQVALKRNADTSTYFSPWVIFALALYGASFFLTIRVLAVNALSVASPVMAGATFLLIAMAAVTLFGESLPLAKIAGMTLIVAGIALLAWR
ncbi:MAG: SMR family transporter [Gallionella sp.]|nr:SMR family transporter [Gallionella sp.]